MSGTGGSLIVREINQIDGYINPITVLGTTSFTFVDLVSSLIIHNVTGDFIRVSVTTVPASVGNGFVFIAPLSVQAISNSPEAIIQSLDILDLGLTGKGGGHVICNSFFR